MKAHISKFSAALIAAGIVLGQLLFVGQAANAYDPDNLVPTSNYSAQCYNGTISNSAVCATDNGAISVYMESSVSSNMRSRIRDALDNSYDPIPAISIAYVGSPTTSGDAETDIMYQQGSIPFAGAIGITWCDDAVNSQTYRCDQQYVRFTTVDTYERRYLTCHETGHAVGLLHGQQAGPQVDNQSSKLFCMKAAFSPDDYTLGSNNATQIDDSY